MGSSYKKYLKGNLKKDLGAVPTPFTKDDFNSPLSPEKLTKAKFFLDNLDPFVRQTFKEFKISQYMVTRADSPGYWYDSYKPEKNPTKGFKKSNDIWFAFAFSKIGKAPVNDLPNISTWLHRLIFEICVDAEIQASQRVFIERIEAEKTRFDGILETFNDLVFRSYLKFEHQPRYYHWIPIEHKLTKEIDSSFIVNNYRSHEESFKQKRDFWINYILKNNHTLSSQQADHLQRQNKRLNLVQTLSFPIEPTDPLWNQTYETQLERFKSSIIRLKPFVEFFIR